jgi:glyoxylase-like metal-dependent hydrolase (beta-lactamase superfamily II)
MLRIRTLASLFALTATAAAQIDLSGEYAPRFHEDQPERIPGPEIGDYLGLPINDAARLRADSWDASLLTLPEHQCKPHPSDYGPRGPANLRIWKEVDTATQQVIAWRTHISWQAPERTIWMDGRPHPPEHAPHTWQGFSTGRWEGDILVVTTTHLKAGWIRRNGVPRSDRATVTEHFIRHGNLLTLVTYIQDPVYLTEPFIRTTDFELDLHQQIEPYPCEAVVEIPRPEGAVPHHLPGANPFLNEFPSKYALPPGAERGGAETMYPGYVGGVSNHPAPPGPGPKPDAPQVAVLPVQGNVFMLVGAGANSAVQAGPDGVLVVDAKGDPEATALLAAIGSISRRPIRTVINTSADADKVGGNAALARAGATITGGNVAPAAAGWGATLVAHENVAVYMAGADDAAIPSNTFFTSKKDLYFNGEAVRLFHPESAHSDADVIVHFRKSDVVATGAIFTPDRYPEIDLKRGGSIDGLLRALNFILDLTVPADKQEGGTLVIPGHGRLCDEADLVEYRDMVTIIRDRIRDAIRKGMTLEQVQAARLTRDYDPLYGRGDRFVEAVYRSLAASPAVSH